MRGRDGASGVGDMEHSRRRKLTNSPRLRQRAIGLLIVGTCVWSLPAR